MTLTTRLLLFFVGTLAVVLAGFSFGVYALTRDYLETQAADRLTAAVRTLIAAAEVGPDGVEWEPTGRALALGPGGEGDIWQISDEQGRPLDGSPASETRLSEIGAAGTDAFLSELPRWEHSDQHGLPWMGACEIVQPANERPARIAAGKHPALLVTVAVPLEPARATQRRLRVTLVGLSAAVLLLASVTGYLICGRALAPVSRMAAAARGMGTADFTERLPVASANDELSDLGRSFNGLLDRLHESFERQRRFTGEAAHQLRTPLAAVLGQAEVALRRERPAAEYRDALDAVRGQAGHLQRIVDALLFLARADAEAGPPAAERLDLAAWLPEHLRSWADHPRSADVQLNGSVAGPAWVHAPPALLGELVNNLIDNALKYSEPGSPVTLRLEREPGTVSLAVEDRGCGVEAADLPNLFRPFFRSADARRRGVPGVGLGLAVAARLAKAFGGDLSATSEPGRGSCFRLRLPAA